MKTVSLGKKTVPITSASNYGEPVLKRAAIDKPLAWSG
jgi:hypothetical protein